MYPKPHPLRLNIDGRELRVLHSIIWVAFIALALGGLWASWDIGVGWDEEAERATLAINLAAIEGLLQGHTYAYEALLAHGDRYYGIGFHLPAYGLAWIIQMGLAALSIPPNSASSLLLAHISVYLCFIASALLVRSLLLRILDDHFIADLGMLSFALWPYLLGHGLMNIKDMPFLFAWLLCTLIASTLFTIPRTDLPNPLCIWSSEPSNRYFSKALNGRIFLLALASAWLTSIRIAGVLIFVQYASMLMSSWYCLPSIAKRSNDGGNSSKHSNNLIAFVSVKPVMRSLSIFVPAFFCTLILLYPVAWHNPAELLNAIGYMSHHPWEGTTLTAGRFIAPGSKLYFYLPVWLVAKLPLIALMGAFITPWVIYRQFQRLDQSSEAQQASLTLWLGLASGTLMVILVLILLRVGLYNELRQTLFLFPLLWIIAIASLAFVNRKLTIVGLILSCIVFIWDNVTLYPYNYSYINELARQRPAMQYFETDYFGFSAGRAARWLSANPQYGTAQCIYAYPTHLLSYDLDSKIYPCLKSSEGNARNLPLGQNQLLYITQRNLINFPIPEQCKLIHSEERTLPLSRQPLIMGRVFSCG